MVDLIALVNDVSSPIKGAWIVWLAWGVVQVAWYRRAQVTAPAMVPRPYAVPPRHPGVPRKRRSDTVAGPAPSESDDVTATGFEPSPSSHSAEMSAPVEGNEATG